MSAIDPNFGYSYWVKGDSYHQDLPSSAFSLTDEAISEPIQPLFPDLEFAQIGLESLEYLPLSKFFDEMITSRIRKRDITQISQQESTPAVSEKEKISSKKELESRITSITLSGPLELPARVPQPPRKIRHYGIHFKKLIALRTLFSGKFAGGRPCRISEKDWEILEGIKNRANTPSSKRLLHQICLFTSDPTENPKPITSLFIEIPYIFDFYCRSVGINGVNEAQRETTVTTQSNHFRWWSFDRGQSRTKQHLRPGASKQSSFPLATNTAQAKNSYDLQWIIRKIALPEKLIQQDFCANLSPIEFVEMIDRLCLRVLTLCFGEWTGQTFPTTAEYQDSIRYVNISFENGFKTALDEIITEYSAAKNPC